MKTRLLGVLVSCGAFFGISGAIALSSVKPAIAAPESNMEMPHGSAPVKGFARIEQPLQVRLAVTAAGAGLIGLELWWFLFSKPKSKQAKIREADASGTQPGIQELDIAVDGGYEPDRIVVQAGQPVRLNFLRKDPNSCLEQVLIPDFQIAKDLPLNKETAIEFTPKQPGDYSFTCGMNMFRGVIQVVPSK